MLTDYRYRSKESNEVYKLDHCKYRFLNKSMAFKDIQVYTSNQMYRYMTDL